MSMPNKFKNKIYIATSLEYPDGNADLRNLLNTLRRKGVECDFLIWGDEKISRGDLLLPLAVWDYSYNPYKFLSWLKYLQASGIQIINPIATIEQNLNKNYLLDFQAKGIPIVPSEFVGYEELKNKDLRGKIVKPIIGQSGIGVEKGENIDVSQYLQGAIVQPFISSIRENGEVSLIFWGGKFRYSVLRKPKEWRANSSHGVKISSIQAKKEWIDLAYLVLDGLDYFYARVDLFIDPLCVNEVELIEPALYFSYQEDLLENFWDCFFNFIKS